MGSASCGAMVLSGRTFPYTFTAFQAGSSLGSPNQASDLGPEPITPLLLEVHVNRGTLDLGYRPFLDSRLSRDDSTSCGSGRS